VIFAADSKLIGSLRKVEFGKTTLQAIQSCSEEVLVFNYDFGYVHVKRVGWYYTKVFCQDGSIYPLDSPKTWQEIQIDKLCGNRENSENFFINRFANYPKHSSPEEPFTLINISADETEEETQSEHLDEDDCKMTLFTRPRLASRLELECFRDSPDKFFIQFYVSKKDETLLSLSSIGMLDTKDLKTKWIYISSDYDSIPKLQLNYQGRNARDVCLDVSDFLGSHSAISTTFALLENPEF
jgi:hypothetical protein